jgi:putative ABC transport system ATP-binding protein
VSAFYELDGVGKKYQGRTVLRDLQFQLHRGEMVALSGPSGAGKSTLLNLIGLIETPDHGKLAIDGRPAPKAGSRAANKHIRHRVAYLFQNFGLIDNATVAANLHIALTYSSSPRPKAEQISDALELVGLAGSQKQRVYTMSGGEQQRVAIARAYLKPSDILLADEPTGSLDKDNAQAVLSLIRGMRDAGKTVVIATHDDTARDACDRTVAIPRLS